jgi:hypothetical protein
MLSSSIPPVTSGMCCNWPRTLKHSLPFPHKQTHSHICWWLSTGYTVDTSSLYKTQTQEDYSKDGYKDGTGFGLQASTNTHITSFTRSTSFYQVYSRLHVSDLIASQHQAFYNRWYRKNYILHRTCSNTKANFRKTPWSFTIPGILKWTDLCVNVKMAWREYFKMFWAQQPYTAALSLIPYCTYLTSNTVQE